MCGCVNVEYASACVYILDVERELHQSNATELNLKHCTAMYYSV